jgi:ankyrin repeat protein
MQAGAVSMLLGLGANVSASTKEGWTPLHMAAGTGSDVVVNMLLRVCARGCPAMFSYSWCGVPGK